MDDPSDSDSGTLNSWKEIASFFGRDVRTVQRWERDEGLPVQRQGGRHGRVWARRTELEAWWSQSGDLAAARPDKPPTMPDAPEPGSPARSDWAGSYGRRAGITIAAACVVVATLIALRRSEAPPVIDGDTRLVVDVRPFSEPNVVVPGGVLAVAITAPDSLLAELDPATIRAAESAPRETRWQDFNGDGRQELWLYFDVSDLALTPDLTRLEIAGRTRDGRLVVGADDVIVVAGGRDSVATVVDRGPSVPDR